MKTLLLMRHSHASSENPAWSDHERPLTAAGRQLASRTGKLLTEYGIDRIICSSAVRTVETADLVAAACGLTPQPNASDALYLAGPSAYTDIAAELAAADDDVLLMIGHNPGIAHLVTSWANESFAMVPASVAVFDLQIGGWTELSNQGNSATSLRSWFSGGTKQR